MCVMMELVERKWPQAVPLSLMQMALKQKLQQHEPPYRCSGGCALMTTQFTNFVLELQKKTVVDEVDVDDGDNLCRRKGDHERLGH